MAKYGFPRKMKKHLETERRKGDEFLRELWGMTKQEQKKAQKEHEYQQQEIIKKMRDPEQNLLRSLETGSRGGQYYVSPSGSKVYVHNDGSHHVIGNDNTHAAQHQVDGTGPWHKR